MSVALFIRHGKASAFGASDYDQLSPPGVEQSEKVGEWLSKEAFTVDAVFLGPRKRHAQTLAAATRVLAAAGGLALPEATLIPELDEHDGMNLVFKMLPVLAADDPALRAVVEASAAGRPPPPDEILAAFKRVTRKWARGDVNHLEVESWSAFRARVVRGMARIAGLGRGKRALIFTSAGVVASAVGEALGVSDERVLDLSWSLYNGSISELDFTGDRWGLRTFNTTAHLPDKHLVTSV